MKQKILIIASVIIFILALFFLNNILTSETNKLLNNSQNKQDNITIKNEEVSKVIEVGNSNFNEEVIKSDKKVLIDFYATWCGPCQMISPIVKEIASENPNIKVVKIDIDKNQEIAMEYSVLSIPTLVVIENGEEVNRIVGVVQKSSILEMLK